MSSGIRVLLIEPRYCAVRETWWSLMLVNDPVREFGEYARLCEVLRPTEVHGLPNGDRVLADDQTQRIGPQRFRLRAGRTPTKWFTGNALVLRFGNGTFQSAASAVADVNALLEFQR